MFTPNKNNSELNENCSHDKEQHCNGKAQRSLKLYARDITLIAMMVAVIEVCKVTLAQVPNVELTSFFIIMFTLYFGGKIIYVIPTFILIEGVMYGFGLWWIMYLYAWPILAIVAWLFKKTDSALVWATVSGFFGLLFGLMCSIPYIFTSGLQGAFAWWIAGIPWDFVHGAGNFAIMFILYKPMKRVLALMRQ